MELDVLIMPNLAKAEFSVEPEHWQDEMLKVKRSFIDKDIYTTGPIIFTKEITGLGEISYTTYIALNDEIEDIPELNIKYVPSLEVFPTISHKCFDDEDFEQIYEEIKVFALENDIILKNQNFYHVMVDYFNGQVYEIHAEIDVSGVELE
ncbi:DUF5085 domain-containing protein [Staphylococcus simulans]|uniref:DUF5085 family protein n=1 Tax=Staphylococcus simulans TaxID=1286 RepID=UPI000D098F13|nr:DUF5085 family protein [Staphylococcus simulans]AVO03093.1 DUF5085 domain-containing protein [Staphylococcus simulans]AVO06048.1 DUF5085 domain-containing protein [Staphylococcus simulans]AWG19641.1 DUF5085 domain-containing protein [Staphylococcus simulans]AWI02590.1 DUF5085 domain-containing protein [Staphylococcus simulans]